MKYIGSTVLMFFVAVACTVSDKQPFDSKNQPKPDSILVLEIQSIIDSHKLKGCILLYDQNANTYYSNNFDWANKAQLPASTFKIPNSIIALELGIVKDSTTILPWNGQPQMNPNWEQDLMLKDAFQFSCVPCYREIARQIGLEKMKDYCQQFNYGNMNIDSSNLDLFWLMGKSKISPFQQIDFLERLNDKSLNINTNTYVNLKYILLRENTSEYQLYGKTGWSNNENKDNTWFVGFLVTPERTIYFATNLEPTLASNLNDLAANRVLLTKQALESIGNITFN